MAASGFPFFKDSAFERISRVPAEGNLALCSFYGMLLPVLDSPLYIKALTSSPLPRMGHITIIDKRPYGLAESCRGRTFQVVNWTPPKWTTEHLSSEQLTTCQVINWPLGIVNNWALGVVVNCSLRKLSPCYFGRWRDKDPRPFNGAMLSWSFPGNHLLWGNKFPNMSSHVFHHVHQLLIVIDFMVAHVAFPTMVLVELEGVMSRLSCKF